MKKGLIVLFVVLMIAGIPFVFAEDVVEGEIKSILIVKPDGTEIPFIDIFAVRSISTKVKEETLEEVRKHPRKVSQWKLLQHATVCTKNKLIAKQSDGSEIFHAECSTVIDVAANPAEHDD